VTYEGEIDGAITMECGDREVLESESIPFCGTAQVGCELDGDGRLRAFGTAGSCGSETGPWVRDGCSRGCVEGFCLSCCF
jgi:hypothetical protein